MLSSTSSYGRIWASEFPDNNEDSFGEDDSKDESTEKKKKKIIIMTNLLDLSKLLLMFIHRLHVYDKLYIADQAGSHIRVPQKHS